MAAQRGRSLWGIPDSDCAVAVGCDDAGAVGAVPGGHDVCVVQGQRRNQISSCGVEDLGAGAEGADDHDPRPVCVEHSGTVNRTIRAATRDLGDLFQGVHVPDRQRCSRPAVRHHRKSIPGGAERQWIPRKVEHHIAGRRIDDLRPSSSVSRAMNRSSGLTRKAWPSPDVDHDHFLVAVGVPDHRVAKV